MKVVKYPDLPSRVARCFADHGATADAPQIFLTMSPADVLRPANFGRGSLAYVQAALIHHGIAAGHWSDPPAYTLPKGWSDRVDAYIESRKRKPR